MASESHMNAAGRASTHSFRDLRSANYARRRNQTGPSFKERPVKDRHACHDRCCASYKNRRRTQNKQRKRQDLHFQLWTNTEREEIWHGREVREYRFWEPGRSPEEHFDGWLDGIQDPVVLYDRLNKGADIFEAGPAFVEAGQAFAAWCQRRISDMRAVKEERVRAGVRARTAAGSDYRLDVSSGLRVRAEGSVSPRLMGAARQGYRVYECSVPTTLPTTYEDAVAHALIRAVLTPRTALARRRRRLPRAFDVSPIHGFGWFGEFSWKWHKNASGCWEIGYDGCDDDDDGAGCGTVPCSCCCEGNGSMYYECSCLEFADGPTPEEQQRCSLVEWVKGRLWDVMVMEAGMEVFKEEDKWEALSSAASESWSIVDMPKPC